MTPDPQCTDVFLPLPGISQICISLGYLQDFQRFDVFWKSDKFVLRKHRSATELSRQHVVLTAFVLPSLTPVLRLTPI